MSSVSESWRVLSESLREMLQLRDPALKQDLDSFEEERRLIRNLQPRHRNWLCSLKLHGHHSHPSSHADKLELQGHFYTGMLLQQAAFEHELTAKSHQCFPTFRITYTRFMKTLKPEKTEPEFIVHFISFFFSVGKS